MQFVMGYHFGGTIFQACTALCTYIPTIRRS